MLQSMGLQRVGHNLATEQQQSPRKGTNCSGEGDGGWHQSGDKLERRGHLWGKRGELTAHGKPPHPE